MKNIIMLKRIAACMLFTILYASLGMNHAVFADSDRPTASSVRGINKVEQALEILAFEEYEDKAPRYKTPITDWEPVFIECEGINHFVSLTDNWGETGRRGYSGRGSDRNRFVSIMVKRFDSQSAAHKQMIVSVSNPSRGKVTRDIDVDDPDKKIGDRCFKIISGKYEDNRLFFSYGLIEDKYLEYEITSEQIIFIRNNILVNIAGVRVRVESLARDLDRQLLELCEPK